MTSPTVVDTDYKKFDCIFSIDLPAVIGVYSYDVNVFPADVTETAGNTINIGECIDADAEKYIFKNCMP